MSIHCWRCVSIGCVWTIFGMLPVGAGRVLDVKNMFVCVSSVGSAPGACVGAGTGVVPGAGGKAVAAVAPPVMLRC